MRHIPAVGIVVVFLLAVQAPPARAQRWELQAVGSQIRMSPSSTQGSMSLVPSVELQRGPLYADVTGLFTSFQGSTWVMQGSGVGSLLLAPAGVSSPIRMELLGAGTATYHSSDFRTASTRGEARLHVASSNAGAWVGGVVTTGSSTGVSTLTGLGPTLGAWGRRGGARASTTFTPLRIAGFWFPQWDAEVAATTGRLDLTGYAGWRGGASGSGIGSETWAGASASWWVTDRIALTISGGGYPSQIQEGLPSGRFLTAGIRITTHRPVVPHTRSLGRPLYEVHRGGGTLRFRLPDAGQVAVVGDWTDWHPVPLRRGSKGSWILNVKLGSGVYRFNLVVDGKRWIVPRGVPSVDNGYGGRSGLLIVP